MKWEAERSEKPTTITAGKLAEEWESKWKLLIGAGKVRIGGKGWEIENIKVTYVVVKYSDFNFVHPSTAEREYNIYWLKDTPPAETQGDGFSESELTALGYELGRYGATTEDRAFAVAEFLRIHTRVQADKMAKLESQVDTLTRELAAARGERDILKDLQLAVFSMMAVGANRDSTSDDAEDAVLHLQSVYHKVESQLLTLRNKRKAAGEVSNGE